MKNNNKIAVLVISCDKYSDLWDPCIRIFNKYWPDCPYDNFIIANIKSFELWGFKNIIVGDDKSWSQGLKSALDKLKLDHDYVYTQLEDYYFIERIDNQYTIDMFTTFTNMNGNFFCSSWFLNYNHVVILILESLRIIYLICNDVFLHFRK